MNEDGSLIDQQIPGAEVPVVETQADTEVVPMEPTAEADVPEVAADVPTTVDITMEPVALENTGLPQAQAVEDPENYLTYTEPEPTPIISDEQAQAVAASTFTIGKLTEEEFTSLSPFEKNFLDFQTTEEALAVSGTKEEKETYAKQREQRVASWVEKKMRGSNLEDYASAWEDLSRHAETVFYRDDYIKEIASRLNDDSITDNYTQFGFAYQLNRAKFSTGGGGDFFGGVYDVAEYATAMGQADTYSEEGKAKQARMQAFVLDLENAMEKEGGWGYLGQVVATDPTILVPLPFVKLTSKAASYAATFGVGAGIEGFLQWLKDDDASLEQYALSMAASGVLNTVFHLGSDFISSKFSSEAAEGLSGVPGTATARSADDFIEEVAVDFRGTEVDAPIETPPAVFEDLGFTVDTVGMYDESNGIIYNIAGEGVTAEDIAGLPDGAVLTPTEEGMSITIPVDSLEGAGETLLNIKGAEVTLTSQNMQVAPTRTVDTTSTPIDDVIVGGSERTSEEVIDTLAGGQQRNSVLHFTEYLEQSGVGLAREQYEPLVKHLPTETIASLQKDIVSIINNPNIRHKSLYIRTAVETKVMMNTANKLIQKIGIGSATNPLIHRLIQITAHRAGRTSSEIAAQKTLLQDLHTELDKAVFDLDRFKARVEAVEIHPDAPSTIPHNLLFMIRNAPEDYNPIGIGTLLSKNVAQANLLFRDSAHIPDDVFIFKGMTDNNYLIGNGKTAASDSFNGYNLGENTSFANVERAMGSVTGSPGEYTSDEFIQAIGGQRVGQRTPAPNAVHETTPEVEIPVGRRYTLENLKAAFAVNPVRAIHNAIKNKAYKRDSEWKTTVDNLGAIFSNFKGEFFHKYPVISLEELGDNPTFTDVANKFLAKHNKNKGVTGTAEELSYSIDERGSTMYIKVLRGGEPVPNTNNRDSGATITLGRRDNEVAITSINVSNLGANTEGALLYLITQAFAAKKGIKTYSAGLYTSNKPARPLHVLSSVVTYPKAAKLFRIDQGRQPAALGHYQDLTKNRPTQKGLLGNAVLDVIDLSQQHGIAKKGLDSGSIAHQPIPESTLNRFGYNTETRKFTVDGLDVNPEVVASKFNSAIDDVISGLPGGSSSWTGKGFNSQVKVSIIGRAALKDLVNVPLNKQQEVINKYKTAIRRDKALSSSGTIDTRSPSGGNAGLSRILYAPIAASVAASAAEGEEEGSNSGLVLTLIAAALLGRVGYKVLSKKGGTNSPEFKAAFKNVRAETIDKLSTLIAQMNQKLTTELAPAARESVLKNLAKAQNMMTEISRHNNIDSFKASLKSQAHVKYLESKQRPVVKISTEKISAISEAYASGDLRAMNDNIDFNLDRIDTTEEVTELINTVSEMFRDTIDVTRRGRVSLESIENSATEMGFDVEHLNKLFGGTNQLAEKFTAARMLFLKVGDDAATIGAKVRDGSATTADRIEFSRLLGIHAAIHASLKASQTEIARALSSMRITSRLNRGGTEVELQRIVEGLAKNGDLDDAMRNWLDMSPFERQLKAKTLTDPNWYTKGVGVTTEYWINSILGAPTTHIVNIMSNAIVAIDALANHVTTSNSAGEALYGIYGFMRGVTEAPIAFGRAFAKGKSQLDNLNKYEIEDSMTASYLGINNKIGATTVDALGNVIRIPSRLLGAEDDFFKMISYRMKLSSETYRIAKSEGLSGVNLKSRINELMEDVDTWVNIKHQETPNNTDDIVDLLSKYNAEEAANLEKLYESAIDVARKNTFTNELGERGQAFQHAVNMNPEARFVVPFIRTPVNILKFFGNKTPLINAIGNSDYRMVIKKATNGEAMTQAEVKTLKEFTYNTVIGSSLLYGAYTSATAGHITGMSPNPNSQTQQQEGWRPYSIRTLQKDGTYTYTPFNRFDPLAMFLGVAADLHIVMNTEDKLTTKTDELVSAALLSFVNNFVNKSYMQGITNFSGIISSNEPAKYDQFIRNFSSSFVPNYIYSVTKSIDPVAREIHSITDALKARIPGMSQDLNPRRDYRGRELPQKSGIVPWDTGKTTNEKLSQAMLDSGLNFPKVEKSFGSVELSPEEYDMYAKDAGEIFNKSATELVNSPEWNTLTDNSEGFEGSKTYMLRKTMSKARQAAKKKLISTDNTLRKRMQNIKEAEFAHLAPKKDTQQTAEDYNIEIKY